MSIDKYSQNVIMSSKNYSAAKRYWLDKLQGSLEIVGFPREIGKPVKDSYGKSSSVIRLEGEVFDNICRLGNQSEYAIYILLLSGVKYLLYRYTGAEDIIVGMPPFTRHNGKLTNTEDLFALRTHLKSKDTYKEFLLKITSTVNEARKYRNIPFHAISPLLGIDSLTDASLVLKTIVSMDGLHEKYSGDSLKPDLHFSFKKSERSIEISLIYNSAIYKEPMVEHLLKHLHNFYCHISNNPNINISHINILSCEEVKQLLLDFNNTGVDLCNTETIHKVFENQVKRTPQNVAVFWEGVPLTYEELDKRANSLALELLKRNLKTEDVVAVLLDKSPEVIVSLLAVLKAGGAYLPIDMDYPEDRLAYMLQDSGAKIIITSSQSCKNVSFTTLQNLKANSRQIKVTKNREPITDFNSLPIPDRSLIRLGNYKNKIGMASAENCISIQATRGCPYSCLFCHRVWSKNHTFRDADNVFEEILYYYRQGVVNFSIIDDCFNLNVENGQKLFHKIIKNRMKIKIFFPNGLRGDLLTPEYINLMVEAGVVNINLSLETASPRLQKLIKKNLDLDKFKEIIDYIALKHPGVILELAAMHGFPTETEEEAMMTLDFIKNVKWIHFPYIHILKIYPNTDMEKFALNNGVSQDDIIDSVRLAYHEIPETLHFSRAFTRRYQSEFLNDYFLKVERLKNVLPVQLKVLGEDVVVEKYRTYFPSEINSLRDILIIAGLEEDSVHETEICLCNKSTSIFDKPSEQRKIRVDAKRILFLDLSQFFSDYDMLYKVSEQPLGQIYLLTYLNELFGDRIEGRICKSGTDFDSYDELKSIVQEFKPDMIGIRSLSFYREFFHTTVALLRQWGVIAPIIAGGPYATSDYGFILQDKNIDIAILGEGELTLSELVEKMLANGFELPEEQVLADIKGIAYAHKSGGSDIEYSREIILYNSESYIPCHNNKSPYQMPEVRQDNLAYIMYTSGTSGRPKGVMVEHAQVINCINWMQEMFKLCEKDIVVQRTNLMFDPSVWEIFWPLHTGACTRILTARQSKDAEFLVNLLINNSDLTVMYCPASLLAGMTYIANMRNERSRLKIPWLLIGAEPVAPDTVRNFYKYFDGQIVNTYGPTECTINNTYYFIGNNESRSYIPIGKPIYNNEIYITSKDMQIMPVGIPGEICIAGNSVSRGYLNNSEKTGKSFMDNPFKKGRLYKTGDIGMWDRDGNIKISGRIDNQVKVRGYRIELGEIEAILKIYKGVSDCVVISKSSNDSNESIRVCKECGITSKYPHVSINSRNVCNICEHADEYIQYAESYFKTMDDLKSLIYKENTSKESNYDCILVYSCERVATYALYKLVEMGLNVLTATYDNGHMDTGTREDIKRITTEIGVDHIFLKHRNSDNILRESLKSAYTMCKGCIHTSASLAGEYAYKNGIKVVIGETLSRGQIIENKLFKFFMHGITDPSEIEKELGHIQKNTPDIDKNIFDYIDINEIKDRSIYNNIIFIDFYRYCDATNEEIISYLNNTNTYWKGIEKGALYSTNCFICSVGDYNFYHEKGYHYNGGAKSWERRLGHITMDALKKDLKFKITQVEYDNFMKTIRYTKNNWLEGSADKYLCSYIVPEGKLDIQGLREFLRKRLPEYMIPAFFVRMDKIPLTSSGKVDVQALPEFEKSIDFDEHDYIMPPNDKEIKMQQIWQEVLGIEQIGVNENFFSAGGDSIKGIQVALRLSMDFDLSINDIFKHQTIRELARHIVMKSDNMKEKLKKIKQLSLFENDINLSDTYMERDKKAYKSRIERFSAMKQGEEEPVENVLVTGGTGFLGAHIIYEILVNTLSNVYILVRGADIGTACERFKQKLSFYFGGWLYSNYKDRIFILNGNITENNLGLDIAEYGNMLATVDHIINAAANVKFYGQYNEFYESNVKGTKSIIEFALNGRKKQLHHISTMGIANEDVPGKQAILFTEYDCDVGQDVDNFYIKTKMEAEKIIFQAIKEGLEANIYRVGNLVFHSKTGMFQENISDNAFYSTIRSFVKLGKVPDIGTSIKNYNFSFVDLTGKAIVRLMGIRGLVNEVFHLYNPNVLGLNEISRMLNSIGFDIKTIPVTEFCDYLFDNFDNLEIQPYIESIILHSGIIDVLEKTHVVIEHEKTCSILASAGFKWPEITKEHLGKMINHCKEVGFI